MILSMSTRATTRSRSTRPRSRPRPRARHEHVRSICPRPIDHLGPARGRTRSPPLPPRGGSHASDRRARGRGTHPCCRGPRGGTPAIQEAGDRPPSIPSPRRARHARPRAGSVQERSRRQASGSARSAAGSSVGAAAGIVRRIASADGCDAEAASPTPTRSPRSTSAAPIGSSARWLVATSSGAVGSGVGPVDRGTDHPTCAVRSPWTHLPATAGVDQPGTPGHVLTRVRARPASLVESDLRRRRPGTGEEGEHSMANGLNAADRADGPRPRRAAHSDLGRGIRPGRRRTAASDERNPGWGAACSAARRPRTR